MGLLGSSRSSYPLLMGREGLNTEGIHLITELCQAGDEVMQVKPNCSFYPLLCGHPWFFCSFGLLQLLNWTLKLSESYFFLEFVKSLFWCGGQVLGSPRSPSCCRHSICSFYGRGPYEQDALLHFLQQKKIPLEVLLCIRPQ